MLLSSSAPGLPSLGRSPILLVPQPPIHKLWLSKKMVAYLTLMTWWAIPYSIANWRALK